MNITWCIRIRTFYLKLNNLYFVYYQKPFDVGIGKGWDIDEI